MYIENFSVEKGNLYATYRKENNQMAKVDLGQVIGPPGPKGDTPVKGTDYFTEADKQEIAEQAAGLVNIPSKLPNPNALTFTGAVTGSYDGSAAVTVEIPSGGAYEGIYSLLVEHTITEDVSEVVYTNEEYPGIANLKHILISIIFPERHTTGWWKVLADGVTIISSSGVSNVKHYYGIADVKCGHWIWSVAGNSNDSAGQALSSPSVMFSPKIGYVPTVYNDYSSLRIYGSSFTLTAGTVVRIWGCDL